MKIGLNMTGHISSGSNSILVLTLLVLLGGAQLKLVSSIAETSGPYDPNAEIEIYYETTNQREQSSSAGSPPNARPELYQQQRRKNDFQDSNLKRYLIKGEIWRLFLIY